MLHLDYVSSGAIARELGYTGWADDAALWANLLPVLRPDVIVDGFPRKERQVSLWQEATETTGVVLRLECRPSVAFRRMLARQDQYPPSDLRYREAPSLDLVREERRLLLGVSADFSIDTTERTTEETVNAFLDWWIDR